MIKTNTHPEPCEEGYWKLVKNSATCNICNETISSKNRHDFVSCKCENVSVDGGLSYIRRSFKTDAFKDDCEWVLLSKENLFKMKEYYKNQLLNNSMDFYSEFVSKGEELLKKYYSV